MEKQYEGVYSIVDNFPDKQKWRKIVSIFLSINLNISFGSSNCSIEYTQHMFCLKNKKINIQLLALIRRPD